ncbi:hypothetical protein AVEN_192053-1 [Araneus ventricosus]|uniref:Uncharacterized protein n=1 Tax=Araneus ventricosus TaxID=182803 RepID=A0A4Y2B7W0_ARAVE|nr:hypothetical protein AVEN_192053-1 [Araneus ventricosus]
MTRTTPELVVTPSPKFRTTPAVSSAVCDRLSDADEGKTRARFEPGVSGCEKDAKPHALSSPCEETFDAVMEYRKKKLWSGVKRMLKREELFS